MGPLYPYRTPTKMKYMNTVSVCLPGMSVDPDERQQKTARQYSERSEKAQTYVEADWHHTEYRFNGGTVRRPFTAYQSTTINLLRHTLVTF